MPFPVTRDNHKGPLKNALAVMILTLGLGGCESLTAPGGLFGDDIKPPLPGERISVLANQRSLSADAALSGQEILLPAPTPNNDWPQAGGFANHAMHHITVSDNLNVSVGYAVLNENPFRRPDLDRHKNKRFYTKKEHETCKRNCAISVATIHARNTRLLNPVNRRLMGGSLNTGWWERARLLFASPPCLEHAGT